MNFDFQHRHSPALLPKEYIIQRQRQFPANASLPKPGVANRNGRAGTLRQRISLNQLGAIPLYIFVELHYTFTKSDNLKREGI
jgi:hypothetical protein